MTDGFSCNIFPANPERINASTNHILRIIPLVNISKIDTAQIFSDPTKALVQRDYYDALLRPYMSIAYHNTPQRNHTATLTEYDCYSRPTRQWLPVPLETQSVTPATFVSNSRNYYTDDSRACQEYYYSTATWDNGVLRNEQTAWQPAGQDMGGHRQTMSVRGNNAGEVRRFRVTDVGTLQCDG